MIEPDVRIIGDVEIGENVSICGPAELMAKDCRIVIGDGCDIAAFTVISTADSHMRCIGLAGSNERRPIILEENVFVGTGAIILGGTHVGHHSVIGAGVVLKGQHIPPYSRVAAPMPDVEPGYYAYGMLSRQVNGF